jgi:hypothetical protein
MTAKARHGGRGRGRRRATPLLSQDSRTEARGSQRDKRATIAGILGEKSSLNSAKSSTLRQGRDGEGPCQCVISIGELGGDTHLDSRKGVEMADERTRRLQLSKYYCSERTIEIRAELVRLESESAELKAELDGPAEPERQGVIRRRRAYLNRRNDELKTERDALVAELQSASEGLKSVSQAESG